VGERRLCAGGGAAPSGVCMRACRVFLSVNCVHMGGQCVHVRVRRMRASMRSCVCVCVRMCGGCACDAGTTGKAAKAHEEHHEFVWNIEDHFDVGGCCFFCAPGGVHTILLSAAPLACVHTRRRVAWWQVDWADREDAPRAGAGAGAADDAETRAQFSKRLAQIVSSSSHTLRVRSHPGLG
jgi:hypothetical protein